MNIFAGSIPQDKPNDIIAWAESDVRLVSVRSERFRSTIAPWLIQPLIYCADNTTRIVSFCKPVQSGGSVIGEIMAAYWSLFGHGLVQFNWEDDGKAKTRYLDRIEPCLSRTIGMPLAIDKRISPMPEIRYPSSMVRVQGVFVPDALDSDSVPCQINEEIHRWKPGHLDKARNRQTACVLPKALDISNASEEKDQWHTAFGEGTMQYWEVQCPGCRQWHRMREEWNDERPDLGGLRYDANGCRLGDGEYDYNLLEPTIRYQMPCGYEVRDEERARKALSLSGRYGDPTNKGAHLSHRSLSLDAVAVDYIPWLKLIRQKHAAVRAMTNGDPEPYKRYVQERACRFWRPDSTPIHRAIVLSTHRRMSQGLKDHKFRFAFLDRQQGVAALGDNPYWWLMIVQTREDGTVMPVYSDRVSDEEAVNKLNEFGVKPWCVACDSGDDTSSVYAFCLEHGFNATKGEGLKGDDAEIKYYKHKDGAQRIYSDDTEDYVCERANAYAYCQKRDDEGEDEFALRFKCEEPRFIRYSKVGLYDRLDWLQRSGKWVHPADANQSYRMQMKAWERQSKQSALDLRTRMVWRKVSEHDHLWACAAGITLLMERMGLIGQTKEKDEE